MASLPAAFVLLRPSLSGPEALALSLWMGHFLGCFWATTGSAQGLLLRLTGEPCGVMGIEVSCLLHYLPTFVPLPFLLPSLCVCLLSISLVSLGWNQRSAPPLPLCPPTSVLLILCCRGWLVTRVLFSPRTCSKAGICATRCRSCSRSSSPPSRPTACSRPLWLPLSRLPRTGAGGSHRCLALSLPWLMPALTRALRPRTLRPQRATLPHQRRLPQMAVSRPQLPSLTETSPASLHG